MRYFPNLVPVEQDKKIPQRRATTYHRGLNYIEVPRLNKH